MFAPTSTGQPSSPLRESHKRRYSTGDDTALDDDATSTGDGDGDGDGDDCEELSEADANSPAQLRSCEPHDQDPQLDAEQVDALGFGQAALAIDLYHVLRDTSAANKSFSISPYSLQAAFGMLYAGTVEPARSELESTLHFTLGDDQHAGFNWLDAQLDARNLPKAEDADPVIVRPVNRTWVAQGIVELIKPDYLDLLGIHYDTGMFLGDFGNQADVERGTINAWVSEQTNDLIPELFAMGEIDGNTKIVLVNALYIAAPWATSFDVESTSPRTFTGLDGMPIDVEMMHSEMAANLDQGAGWESVSVPLRGGELVFTVIVPSDFEAFEASLDAETLAAILAGSGGQWDPQEEPSWGLVELSLPRFELESSHKLLAPLVELGMPSLVEPGSFTDIAELDFEVETVVQQTVIRVDEGGIEAAAATGITAGTPSLPPSFQVDRPFFLAIHDLPTNALLFFGRVLEPTDE